MIQIAEEREASRKEMQAEIDTLGATVKTHVTEIGRLNQQIETLNQTIVRKSDVENQLSTVKDSFNQV